MKPEQAIESIRSALTTDLLKPRYRALVEAGANRMTGHCFVASEALYHLMGGKGSGYIPNVGQAPDGSGTHWWVVGPDGRVHDPTFDQFEDPVDYAAGRGTGFGVPGGGPCKRARRVLEQVTPTDEAVALFVRKDGPYPRMVEEWFDEQRDARTYSGWVAAVVHPPCSNWSKFSTRARGEDGGLFAFALDTIARVGGVLEHPAYSTAWAAFGLPRAEQGRWQSSLFKPGLWCTEVAQRNYGHRARKMTWLCVASEEIPAELDWSKPEPAEAWASWSSKRFMRDNPTAKPKMMRRERETTPDRFARMLIGLARASVIRHAVDCDLDEDCRCK